MESVSAGAEVLFRVRDIVALGDGAVSGWMDLGPWSTGADGRTALGALAVIADDTLGYAIVEHPARPADHGSVSTEITVDAIGGLPEHGAVQALARTVAGDALGAIATGELRDAAGRTFALVSQRAHWVPLDGMRDPRGPQPAFAAPEATGVAELIGIHGERGRLAFEVGEALRNPAGSLHGGVSMAASAIAAADALTGGGPPLRVRGIRTSFPRPTLLGDGVELDVEVLARGRTTGVVDVATTVDGRARTLSRITAGS